MSARFFLMVFVATIAFILGGTIFLPHNRYLRFQELAKESVHYLRAKWIYERIHFDNTPIDIAFIGTSHTQSAINSQLVEETLHQNGIDQHVVNFAIPHLGRDLHYLIVRELIENRRVRKLVIETQETEARAPHPAFQRLADVADLVASPLIVNTGYAENFALLPLRQFTLFLHTYIQNTINNKLDFDPLTYEGQHWDDTYQAHGTDKLRLAQRSVSWMEKEVSELEHNARAKNSLADLFTLPRQPYSLLERYQYIYLEGLLDLAKSKGIEVVFLYLPYFHGPEDPKRSNILLSYGLIFHPKDVLDDTNSWQNVDHLNAIGAERLSRWLGQALTP